MPSSPNVPLVAFPTLLEAGSICACAKKRELVVSPTDCNKAVAFKQTTNKDADMTKKSSSIDLYPILYAPPTPRIVGEGDFVWDELTEMESDNLERVQEENLNQARAKLEETKRRREERRLRTTEERLRHMMRRSTNKGRIIPEEMVRIIPCYYDGFGPSEEEVRKYVLSNGYIEKVEWYEDHF